VELTLSSTLRSGGIVPRPDAFVAAHFATPLAGRAVRLPADADRINRLCH
jgi:hypothetical protein